MKKIIAIMGFCFALGSASFAFAEGKGNGGDDFRKAAKEYEKMADKAGKSNDAKSYKRLAEIKRNAAKLADQGRWDDISWDEYHAITATLKGDGKKHHKGKKYIGKKHD